MPSTLTPDATVETVWRSLTHQRDYVSGVLQAMRRCNAKHGNSSVKIGVTGTVKANQYGRFSCLALSRVASIFLSKINEGMAPPKPPGAV